MGKGKGPFRVGVVAFIVLLPFLTWLFLQNFTRPVFNTLPYQYSIENGDTLWHELPDFAFTDQDGKAVSRADLRETLTVISFFNPSEATEEARVVNLVLNGNLKTVYDNIKDAGFIKMMTVGTDPTTGEQNRMKAYAVREQIDTQIWPFVVGDSSTVFNMLGPALRLPDTEAYLADQKPFTSPWVILVDKKGKVRDYYIATDLADIKRLNQDILALLKIEYPEELKK